MITYALVAFLLINGQVVKEEIDWGMTLDDCEFTQTLLREVVVRTEADVVPLACVEERVL